MNVLPALKRPAQCQPTLASQYRNSRPQSLRPKNHHGYGYDYPTAAMVDAAGVEGILVGDSLSMVVQGHDTTLPVTLDEMAYHAALVGRAVHQALVVVDMPFPSFHLGVHRAIESAGSVDKNYRLPGC